jgi:trigger factor
LKTTVTEPESWKRVIEIEVSPEELSAATDAKLEEYRRTARLPGFRQGKVPLSVVKQRFGQGARAEAIDDTVKSSYKSACEEHKIEPVSGASLTGMKGEEGEPLRFTLETEVDPPIEIKNYDKLKARAKPAKVKDADVDEAFSRLLDRFAEFKEVGRPAKKGDFVRVEYRRVAIDGAERPDLKNHNPNYPIELGGEGVFKEFDKGLTGRSAGDEVEISVKFPKDYGDQSAAGKTGEFSVAVLEVQEKRLPEANEEFLKKLGSFDSVEALKGDIRRGMEQDEEQRAKKAAHGEAIEELISGNPFEVPPSKLEAFINMTIEDYAQQNRGARLEPPEELAERLRPSAVTALKRIRIVDYVADKENIKAAQEEVDKEIEQIAQRYGHEFDQLKQLFRKNGTTNRIRTEIRERKTLDFLIGEGKA